MTPLSIWYAHDQGGAHIAATPDEIDAALDHVASLADKAGCVATVVRRGTENPGLYVGINGEVGALYYTDASEAYWSQGHESADGVPLLYDWQWNVFEFPPNAEVPVANVRAAVHEFARTGTRPSGIQWQGWEPPREPGGAMPDPYDPNVWG